MRNIHLSHHLEFSIRSRKPQGEASLLIFLLTWGENQEATRSVSAYSQREMAVSGAVHPGSQKHLKIFPLSRALSRSLTSERICCCCFWTPFRTKQNGTGLPQWGKVGSWTTNLCQTWSSPPCQDGQRWSLTVTHCCAPTSFFSLFPLCCAPCRISVPPPGIELSPTLPPPRIKAWNPNHQATREPLWAHFLC